MGFFKDLNKLSKQGKEMQKTYDPGAQMASGLEQMKQANAMMAQQTEAASAAANGTAAQLQVTGSRDTGTVLNLQPVLEIDLLVVPDGGAPYPTTIRQVVPMASLARVAPGGALRGKVDPSNPASVWIDWSA